MQIYRNLLFAGLMFVPFLSQSQSYGSALGLRFGNDNIKRTMGLTYQQRIFKKITVETILQSDFQYNHTLHGMIQFHQPLITRRLNFYSGGGFSMGIEQSEEEDPVNKTLITTYDNKTLSGDLVVGLELTMLRYAVSLDYKPNFNVIGRNPWYAGQVGVSGRVVIVTGARQNKKWREKAREKRKKERQEKREESPLNNLFRRDGN